jgi:hypothetical protein
MPQCNAARHFRNRNRAILKFAESTLAAATREHALQHDRSF